MRQIATLLLTMISLGSIAQNSSLTIFNNNGQQFFVIMNGIRQNSIPETNVKVNGMTLGAYEIKLIFADGKTGDVNKKVFFDVAGNYQARVVFKGKKRKLQFFGMSDGAPAPAPAGGTEIQYRPNDQTGYTDQSGTTQGQPTGGAYNGSGSVNGQSSGTNQQSGQSTTNSGANGTASGTANTAGQTTGRIGIDNGIAVQKPNGNGGYNTETHGNTNNSGNVQQSTTVTDPNNTNGEVKLDMDAMMRDPNMNGSGGIQVQVLGDGTSTTTTTTSSSTTQNGQVTNTSTTYNQTTSTTQGGQTTTTTQSSQYGTPTQGTSTHQSTGSNGMNTTPVNTPPPGQLPPTNTVAGLANCATMLQDVTAFVAELDAEAFDSNKRKLITEDLANSCVTAEQAYKIIEALSFDADRLDMSKFLYDRMTDKGNAKKMLELFSFDVDKQAFRDYMRKH